VKDVGRRALTARPIDPKHSPPAGSRERAAGIRSKVSCEMSGLSW
jgi:hypothetical protein